MLRQLFILLVCIPCLVYAKGKKTYHPPHPDSEAPWLTGPLLAPAVQIVPVGHVDIEPYIYAMATTGQYNNEWKSEDSPTFWINTSQTLIEFGLTSWMDLQINPTFVWNYTKHKGHWAFGDLPIDLNIQLHTSAPESWIPTFKFVFKETVPTGKYRNLDPKKDLTDQGGFGSWNSGLGIVVGKLVHFTSVYYLSWRFSLLYAIPASVHIKGFNAYGGGYGTDGHLIPARSLQADLGLEFTLAQTWAFALDITGSWSGKTHFSGVWGTTSSGEVANIGQKASVVYSLAPAIEYNWSANLGIIAGGWFTIAGKNSSVFSGGVIALNYYH